MQSYNHSLTCGCINCCYLWKNYFLSFLFSSLFFFSTVQVSNHPSPITRGSNRGSPRTAPVRSIHSADPFQFSSPVKGPSTVAISRSLSFDSLRKQDQVQNILKKERFSKMSRMSPSSVGDLSRSLDPNGTFAGKISRGMEESNVSQSCGSVEEGSNSNDSSTMEGFAAKDKGEKTLTVTIPNRKRSEGLSSSALVLHESHFWEPDSSRTPSPPLSSGTPLGMSYPGTRSIPGSKPVVIGKYGSTSSREEQSSVDLMEYDLINESDFSSLRSNVANPSFTDDYLVVEGFPGIQSSTM